MLLTAQSRSETVIIGDLLFGQDPSEEHTGNSIVESFRLNYGYQILGLLIAKELSKNVVAVWQAEVSARQVATGFVE